jgi:2',3'-cyclic-nucleotide 2'-phosphodiesterase (5'-nucleotidase family)
MKRVLVLATIAAVLWIWLYPLFVSGRGSRLPASVVILASGGTRGYLEPCGCQAGMAGGLAPRHTLIQQQRTAATLLVDAGDLFGGTGTYEQLKGEFLLRGMKRMGYDAVNIGLAETQLGADKLKKLIAPNELPFVSCNVQDAQTRKLLTKPVRIWGKNGLHIAITGITEAEPSLMGKGLTVRPHEEALAELLPNLRKRYDLVVVLADAPADELQHLAERFPEVDVLIGTTPNGVAGQADSGNAAIFMSAPKGRTLGKLTLARQGNSRLYAKNIQSLPVASSLAPAPEIAAVISQFKDELRSRRLEMANAEGMERIETTATATNTGVYVGQAKCVSCHQNADKITAHSAHAHAYQTLADKNADADPSCLRCHTVGFGAKDGFVTLEQTPHLANVQCESCHGRGSVHVATAQAGKTGRDVISMLPALTPNHCQRCHDPENSPRFSYPAFWQKIRH